MIYSPEKKGMYCPYCGSSDSQERTMEECDMETCPNCGGQIPVEEHTSAIICPYCDHSIILNPRVEGEFAPQKIIPFQYSRDMIKNLLREKFKKNIFAPTDFLSDARLNSMTGEYVPFWMYDYRTGCDYQGEGVKIRTWSSGNRQYTETSYYNVARSMEVQYQNIPADASVRLPDAVMDLMEPYQYGGLVDFKPEYMSGFQGEKYNMNWDMVESRARTKMEGSARRLLQNSLGGYSSLRTLRQSVNVLDTKAGYNLLPVWKYIYQYDGQTYPFFVNGQTGKVVGKIPISRNKVLAYGLTLWLCLLGISWILIYLVGGLF